MTELRHGYVIGEIPFELNIFQTFTIIKASHRMKSIYVYLRYFFYLYIILEKEKRKTFEYELVPQVVIVCIFTKAASNKMPLKPAPTANVNKLRFQFVLAIESRIIFSGESQISELCCPSINAPATRLPLIPPPHRLDQIPSISIPPIFLLLVLVIHTAASV